jgi:hypothetical protein
VYTGDDLRIKTARIDFDPWADQWYKGPCQKAKIVLKYPVKQNERKGTYLRASGGRTSHGKGFKSRNNFELIKKGRWKDENRKNG